MNATTQSMPPLYQVPQLLVKKSHQKYYFPLPRWNAYVDLYHHLLAYSSLSFIMTGTVGLGKTTLLTQLRERLADITFCYYLQADDQTSAEQITRIVQNAFAKPPIDSSRQPLLMIDDAHELSITTLDFLVTQTRRPTQSVKGLRFMLCGNELLWQKLAELPISNEMLAKQFHHLALPPLSLVEMKEYLGKRLSLSHRCLSPAQWQQIYQLADGHIDTMLVLAKKMQREVVSKKNIPSRRHKISLWSLVVVGVFLTLMTLGLWWEYQTVKKRTTAVTEGVNAQSESLFLQPSSAMTAKQQTLAAPRQSATKLADAQTAMNAQSSPATAGEPTLHVRQQQLESIKQELAFILMDRRINYVNISQTGFLAVARQRAQRLGYKQSVLQSMRKAQLMQAHLGMVKSKPLTTTPTKPSGYTIQLLATHNEQALLDFIKRHQLSEQTRYFTTLREGQPWFVLTLGQYPTMEAARHALSTLPSALHAAKPWPRSFNSIKLTHSQKE